MAAPEFNMICVRGATQSIGSSVEAPRTCVELLLPSGMSALGIDLVLRRLKRKALTAAMAIGNKDLFAAGDALILDCHSPAALAKVNPLCSEALFLSADRLLVRTEASADTWVELLDRLCREGEATLISGLRWKASRFGGRPFALPSVTLAAMAASRRRRGKNKSPPQQVDCVTELRVNGDPGLQDRRIFDQLIAHVCQHTGLQLSAYDADCAQHSGFWKHLASFDTSAPPGRARLYLGSCEEVQRVYHSLHGQLVQVGDDWLAVTVHNDILDAAPVAGNGNRVP